MPERLAEIPPFTMIPLPTDSHAVAAAEQYLKFNVGQNQYIKQAAIETQCALAEDSCSSSSESLRNNANILPLQ